MTRSSTPDTLAWIARFLAEAALPLPAGGLGEGDSFHDLGVDSALGMELVFALGEHRGVEIDPTLIFDCRTVQAFADAVDALAAEAAPTLAP